MIYSDEHPLTRQMSASKSALMEDVESRDQGTAVIRLQLTIFGLDVERLRSLRIW